MKKTKNKKNRDAQKKRTSHKAVESTNLYHDRQWFNTLIAWPLTRWLHIPNDIILQTSSSDPWN